MQEQLIKYSQHLTRSRHATAIWCFPTRFLSNSVWVFLPFQLFEENSINNRHTKMYTFKTCKWLKSFNLAGGQNRLSTDPLARNVFSSTGWPWQLVGKVVRVWDIRVCSFLISQVRNLSSVINFNGATQPIQIFAINLIGIPKNERWDWFPELIELRINWSEQLISYQNYSGWPLTLPTNSTTICSKWNENRLLQVYFYFFWNWWIP